MLLTAIAASLALLSCKGAAEKGDGPATAATAVTSEPGTASKCEYPAAPPDTAAVVQIRGDERALPCRLVLRTVLTLDNAAFDVDHLLANIVRNSRGEYIVTGRGNVLGLLDAAGKLIRTFGRDGNGPGEFHQINPLHVAAFDTVYAFDGSQRRMTVIDPSLSRLVRIVSVKALSGNQTVLPLPQSQLLVGGQIFAGMQPDTLFNTLHILKADGSMQRAWNTDTMSANRAARNRSKGTRELPGRSGPVMSRSLSPNADGGALAARANSYTIEQWSKNFELVRTFERRVDWFPVLQQDGMFTYPVNDSTPAQIYGVTTDSTTGNILVQIVIASRKWKAPADVRRTAEGTTSSAKIMGDLTNYVDTIFESFDAHTGTLTSSARLPGYYAPLRSDNQYWTRRGLPDGDVVIDIIKLELVSNAQPAK